MHEAGTIAFDLDMTLVDSRPVSRQALERLVAEYGVGLDIAAVMATYGLPLSRWLPADVDVSLFRALQSEEISLASPMPGAGAAIEAVRRAGARVAVVTAAPVPIAIEMLDASGLSADRLHGDVWADGKVKPLREEACWGLSAIMPMTWRRPVRPARGPSAFGRG